MFKALAFFLVVAVVATNAQDIFSGSSNNGMNVLSTGSSVFQNDIQNVNGGYGGQPGWGGIGHWGGIGNWGGIGHWGHPGLGYGYGHPGLLY